MTGRISTNQIFGQGINKMMSLTQAVNDTQLKISTGKRILTPADDPVASTRVLQLDQEIALTNQYQNNTIYVTSRLQQEEGIISGIEDGISRIRELTVAAGNGAYTMDDRKSIALEVKQRVEELFTNMNKKDSNGEYLFSGFNGQTQPFVKNPGGGYKYQGDEGQRFLQIATTTTVATSDSGKSLFLDIDATKNTFNTYGFDTNTGKPTPVISSGITTDQEKLDALFPDDAIIEFNHEFDVEPPKANYTVRRRSDNHVIDGLNNVPFSSNGTIEFSGMQISITGSPNTGDNFVIQTTQKQGILDTFEKFLYGLENLEDNPDDRNTLSNLLDDTLTNLDSTTVNISEVRAQIGARLNTTESTENLHAELKLVAQEVRSKIADIDFAEAVSQLQMESFVLEASQQSYAKVTALSLFDYLR
ncbi:flagellar hook-associated protein FlgL [Marinicellulosiphila megalodicopiae]|uniref:flagellar hook-associated protein FlgL n=1 Tax=Marinicellulosiphila megalodicopiae TaxID=2724896 RepID=UPI003BAF33BC